ncbi:hypothetical protein [Streptomyces sp. G-G2]|uniref:hypothetical protein n=1 Tax=Streptomyces sp. G-G2 TaxID=3046201 RepID=UPI0024BBD6AC|nr:hypothetical protein [Streptomyces sp. G-G2]MDJ0386116.1 hypothetical protein [Streptomyces sp. G-G2]
MSTDTATAPRLSLVDLYILGDLIAARLGEAWTKADDTTDTQAVSFDHTAGHTISIRRLWDGVGAQTSLRMEGLPTYNAGVVFSDSEGTSDTLLKAIEERLLPAVGGHRPKLQQSGTPHPPKADPQKSAEQAPAGDEPAQDGPDGNEPAQPNNPPTDITAPTAPAAAKPPTKKTPAGKPKTATAATKTTTPRRAPKATGVAPRTAKRATTRKATAASA